MNSHRGLLLWGIPNYLFIYYLQGSQMIKNMMLSRVFKECSSWELAVWWWGKETVGIVPILHNSGSSVLLWFHRNDKTQPVKMHQNSSCFPRWLRGAKDTQVTVFPKKLLSLVVACEEQSSCWFSLPHSYFL